MIDEYVQQFQVQLAKTQEAMIGDQLAITFGYNFRVTTRKPWWMPGRMYRWLFRTALVEITPLTPLGTPA